MGSGLERLAPATRWIGRRLDIHAEVDSTNRVAEALARAGAPEGTLVVADRQTAGRGRLGRSFFSPGGVSLYLSLVLRPPGPAERAPEHVFAAAVAVAEAARRVLPSPERLEIKWPNDVLVAERKLSGINLPASLDGARIVFAVLGIGINVNTPRELFPEDLREIATSLAIECGASLDRVAFAEGFLLDLERELDRLRQAGFGAVLDRWRESFRMTGAQVRVGGPGLADTPAATGGALRGVVRGVDDRGALMLETERGLERIVAGDVTLLERPRRSHEPGSARS
jgi:BirA family biotin operon repressor/biotin-[acetyl-CoA-carboxylase] ligase